MREYNIVLPVWAPHMTLGTNVRLRPMITIAMVMQSPPKVPDCCWQLAEG